MNGSGLKRTLWSQKKTEEIYPISSLGKQKEVSITPQDPLKNLEAKLGREYAIILESHARRVRATEEKLDEIQKTISPLKQQTEVQQKEIAEKTQIIGQLQEKIKEMQMSFEKERIEWKEGTDKQQKKNLKQD